MDWFNERQNKVRFYAWSDFSFDLLPLEMADHVLPLSDLYPDHPSCTPRHDTLPIGYVHLHPLVSLRSSLHVSLTHPAPP